VGGIFRNCAAFGVGAVLFDEVTCDPLYRKAIRVSSGATLYVPYARCASSAAMLALLRERGFTRLALTPDPGAVDIARLGRDVPMPERAVLVLGAEGPGLTDTSLAQADLRVRVAMTPGFDSLNVATTSGIALHRLFSGG
jgi:tRNA G18 (ribose-2'-O)-methylase SpoU